MRSLSLFVIVCTLAAVAVPRVVFADGQADEADLQFQVGADAYRKGDFTVALEHFMASNRLVPNRNVMFNIARAYEQLGKYPEAYRYYVDALRGESDAQTIKTVEGAIERVNPKVAVVEVNAQPAGATVYLERRDLGSVGTTPARLGLSAGTYKLLIEAQGYEPWETQITVQTGTRTKVEHELVRILGTMDIGGDPGIEVRLDDENGPVSCVTPCKLDAPPGPHVLHFTARGAAIAPRPVTVEAKQTIKVKPELVPLTGSILVSADEPNALVEIDGEPRGFTPAVIANVPIGKRKVRISLSGYESVERVVEVRASAQTDIRDIPLNTLRQVSAASRSTESVEDAPASVSIITAQELEAFAYPTILEALRGTRGVSPTFDSAYGNITVRGLGQPNDYTNRLLVLSDGMTLNENVLYQPFLHYDGRSDLGDVDRIEVVRGPGSVLYGTGAESGVINLVMRGREEPTSIQGGISSYDNEVARGRLAITYRSKDFGFWNSFAATHSDGRQVDLRFIDQDPTTPTSHLIDGFDSFHTETVTGKLWYKDFTIQWFGTARDLRIPTGGYGSLLNAHQNEYFDRRGLIEAKYEPKLGKNADLLLRAYTNFNYFRLNFLYGGINGGPTADGGDGTNLGCSTQANYDPTVGCPYNQKYYEEYPSAWSGAEARIRFQLGNSFKLTLGSEVVIDNQVAMNSGYYGYDNSFTQVMNFDTPYQIYAGYTNLEFRPSKSLLITAGLRLDHWSLSKGVLDIDGKVVTTQDFTSPSPRVAIITHPTSNDIVKLMGGQAFRAPSSYEYFYTDGGTSQVSSSANPNVLKRETVLTAEFEYTHKFNRDWSLLASVYDTYAQDLIQSAPVPQTLIDQHNALGGSVWQPTVQFYNNSTTPINLAGADLEARKEWRAGTMFMATYGVLAARYTQTTMDTNNNTHVPNAPTQYASLRGVTPLVPNLLNGAIRVTLEDERRDNDQTNDNSRRGIIADVVLSGRIARYRLRYAFGVYNLFNWQYALPVNSFPVETMPQQGRSLMFNLNYTQELGSGRN